MTPDATINSNPTNRSVIAEFRRTGGNIGGDLAGMPLLLLTTTGARSGLTRTTPVVHLDEGDRLIIFAGNGGAPNNPHWFYNLMAAGEGVVEVGKERYLVRPVLVAKDEHEGLWARMHQRIPDAPDFRSRTTRTIPIVALTRVHDSP